MDGISSVSGGADNMGSWIDQELAGCVFADERLGRRFSLLMGQLSKGLGKMLPLVSGDWAIARFVGPRERELTDAFLKLTSKYLFQPHFCLVRRANEKGKVECLVGFTRRNFLVPLPRVDDFESLNAELEDQCRKDFQRRPCGKTTTKAQRLEEERLSLHDLPKQSYEARRVEQRRSDSLSMVRCDGISYSVPVTYGQRPVTF